MDHSSSSTVVPHWGIHWAPGGIAFLEQARGGVNALGLKEKSPFSIQPSRRNKQCNHLIPLAAPNPAAHHLEILERIRRDPLFQIMLPIPKAPNQAGISFVLDPKDELNLCLILLSKMSSPIRNVVLPFWTMPAQAIVDELQATNVQPLVLTGMQQENTNVLHQIAQAASYYPRKLVITGKVDVPLPMIVERVTTELNKIPIEELAPLPWENLGALVVRAYMRREWRNNWMTVPPHPGDQAKPPRPKPA